MLSQLQPLTKTKSQKDNYVIVDTSVLDAIKKLEVNGPKLLQLAFPNELEELVHTSYKLNDHIVVFRGIREDWKCTIDNRLVFECVYDSFIM